MKHLFQLYFHGKCCEIIAIALSQMKKCLNFRSIIRYGILQQRRRQWKRYYSKQHPRYVNPISLQGYTYIFLVLVNFSELSFIAVLEDEDAMEERNEDDVYKPASSAKIVRTQSTPDFSGIIDEPPTSRLQCKRFTASYLTSEYHNSLCKQNLRNFSCSPKNFTLRSEVNLAYSKENVTFEPDMAFTVVNFKYIFY